MSNTDLHIARQNAADEFYTGYDDVAEEMQYYPDVFRNKRIFLPCDDYKKSAFYRYFKDNFEALGLATLTAQSIYPAKWVFYNGTEEIVHDTEDGDFRGKSAQVLMILSDIIVTNPPFSLFREFMQVLLHMNKQFIVLGNVNAITYKEIMPGLVNRLIFLGPSIRQGDREFLVPDNYPLDGTACRQDVSTGKKYIRVKGVRWFTNIRTSWTSDNIPELTKSVHDQEYQKFDTYDAINVNATADIPYDYEGEMGVPITALDKSCSDGLIRFKHNNKIQEYRLTGMLNSGNRPEIWDFAKPIIDGKCKFKRILIQRV